MTCPNCGSTAHEVLSSELCSNGTRRRRHACTCCRHRWTSWDGPKPGRRTTGPQRKLGPKRAPLTDEEVRLILTSDLSNSKMSAQIGCSAETVRTVRLGKIYSHVSPELPRRGAAAAPVTIEPSSGGPNCLECVHWRGTRCSFGFPDPVLEGLAFAADCSCYDRVSQSMSLACPTSVQ